MHETTPIQKTTKKEKKKKKKKKKKTNNLLLLLLLLLLSSTFRIMSSIGASYAKIHLLQKQQKDKLERMEANRPSRGEADAATSSGGGSNKVHPGSIAPVADSNKNRT